MFDLVMLVGLVVFFVLSLLFVKGIERIMD